MYEINNHNHRWRAIRHFSNYIILALIIVVMTVVIVLAAQGYDIDRNTGKVIQNGILLVETQPEGASVTLNGVEESAKTPAKYPIPQGEYSLTLEREGYRSWQSLVEVYGTRVNWVYYPLLVPDEIKTTNVQQVKNLNFIASNQQRNAIALDDDSNIRTLTLYDLGASTLQPTALTIPAAAFVERDDKFVGSTKLIDWSENGRYILLEYSYDKQTDYIVVDLDNQANSFNLDKTTSREFSQAVFGDNGNQLVLINQRAVYQLSPTNRQLGNILATNVDEVISHDSKTWIVRKTQAAQDISLLSSPNEIIVTESSSASAQASSWEGKDYLVITGKDALKIYLDPKYDDQYSAPADKVVRLEGMKSVTISPNGRFVSLHGTDSTRIYDLEYLRTYDLLNGLTQDLRWLDGHRFSYSKDGKLHMVDFNGANDYEITGFIPVHGAFTDENSSSIYTISRNSNKQLLLRQSSLETED